MGSIGAVKNSAYSPAWDYDGDGDKNNINTQYFNGVQGMPVNTSLNDWVDEANTYQRQEQIILGRYMQDSSVNAKLRDNPNYKDNEVQQLDRIINSHKLDKDTILYSGLSNDSFGNVNVSSLKVGDTFSVGAYVSTSPDPVYASGYALSSSNTPTVLQISAVKGTPIAKMYYESAYGTEGLLGRGNKFEVTGFSNGQVQGEKVRIVKVKLR